MIVVSSNAFSNEVPNYFNYTFDYISLQIRASVEKEYILDKTVRLINDEEGEKWETSITAYIGNKIEFRIHYANGSNLFQDVTLIEDLPPCFKYIQGEAFLYNSKTPGGKPIEMNMPVKHSVHIGMCAPGAYLMVYYMVEIVDYITDEPQQLIWSWTEAHIDSKILQEYTEIIIE